MNSRQPALFTKEGIVAAAFFAAFIFLLYQMMRLLAPFLSALIWAAVLAMIFYPLNKTVVRMVRGRRNAAAGLMTALVMLLVVGPASAALAALASQVMDLYQWTSEFVRGGGWTQMWNNFKSSRYGEFLAHPYFSQLNIKDFLINNIGDISSGMALQIGDMLKNTLLLLLNVLIMLFSVFFLFRDGESYYNSLLDILPFPEDRKRSVSQKLGDTFSAVIKGVFLIALLQGVMTGAGFAAFGVPYPVLWGSIAAVAALLPIGGAALVWIAGSAYLFITGSTFYGIALSVWGILLVSLPDNLLKPALIGRKARIPTFFLFLGILGGLKVFGILGILFGPIVVTLLAAFINIYREEYAGR